MSETNHPQPFLVRPFQALMPRREFAAEVAAPPYDVINRAEARALAADKPRSFLRVSRAEIDLAPDTDPYSEEVYATAAKRLAAMQADGVLVQEQRAAYYAYQISNGSRTQLGVAVAASVEAYRDNRIRRHELTRPAKETDRVRQIEAVKAITGPVMLVHHYNAELEQILTTAAAGEADLSAEVDGWRHQIWALNDATTMTAVSDLMNRMEALYIADGHHRSAAALRVADQRRDSGKVANDSFLAVSFADSNVTILDYNRVVRDLNGLNPSELLERLNADFEVVAAERPVRPDAAFSLGMYLAGQWYCLRLRQLPNDNDAVASLDVSVLDAKVLRPLLGIGDPRTDPRIDFIGGSRGPQAVAQRIDSGEMAVGFMLYPTAMQALMAVAEAQQIMPPKSTWFEPKLADGLLSMPL